MRAHTITTITRPRRKARRRALGLAVGIAALVIPVSASAFSTTGDYSSVNSISGGSSDSSQPAGGSDYSSVNSISPPASEPSSPSGSADVVSGYTSLNAVTGSPAAAPTFASGSPSGSGEGFDWASAVVGAGAGLALAALGGATLLTVRRRTAISPSASTS